jgi:hypothetical protein
MKQIKVKLNREIIVLNVADYADIKKSRGIDNLDITAQINKLLINCWDEFEEDYIEKQVLTGDHVLLVYKDETLIAISSAKYLKLHKKNVLFIELTAVAKEYQNLNLSKLINEMIIRRYVFKVLSKYKKSFYLMGVTPNIRVIASLGRIVKELYPDPRKEVIEPTPTLLWDMSKELLVKLGKPYSDFLNELDRNGNIIRGYYFDKPDLLKNIQKGYDDKNVELFREKYMSSGEEILFVAKISIIDLLIFYVKGEV